MLELSEVQVATRHGVIHAWRDGEGDHEVVLLHGLGGDHEQALGFTPTAAELGADGRRWSRLAIDLRAHGATEAIGPQATLTFEAFADDVVSVARAATGAGRRPLTAIVGMSMGAEVALHVAARAPRLARALILIRPAWAAGRVPYRMLVPYQQLRAALEASGAAGVDAFVESPEYQAILTQSPQAAQSLRRQFTRPRAAERAAVLTAIPASAQLPIETVREVTLPTVIIASPNDPAHSLACAQELAQALPQGRGPVVIAEKQVTAGEHERQLRDATSAFLRAVADDAEQPVD